MIIKKNKKVIMYSGPDILNGTLCCEQGINRFWVKDSLHSDVRYELLDSFNQRKPVLEKRHTKIGKDLSDV